MEQALIDREISPRDELVWLLDYNGVKYSEDPEGLRFILEESVYKWETVCRYTRSAVLIYGYYPFETSETDETLRLLNRINSRLISGSMLLNGKRVVMRTCADLHEIYGAHEAIAREIEYNASAIVKFWQEIRFINAKNGKMRKEDAPQ